MTAYPGDGVLLIVVVVVAVVVVVVVGLVVVVVVTTAPEYVGRVFVMYALSINAEPEPV